MTIQVLSLWFFFCFQSRLANHVKLHFRFQDKTIFDTMPKGGCACGNVRIDYDSEPSAKVCICCLVLIPVKEKGPSRAISKTK